MSIIINLTKIENISTSVGIERGKLVRYQGTLSDKFGYISCVSQIKLTMKTLFYSQTLNIMKIESTKHFIIMY